MIVGKGSAVPTAAGTRGFISPRSVKAMPFIWTHSFIK